MTKSARGRNLEQVADLLLGPWVASTGAEPSTWHWSFCAAAELGETFT